jgi:hypothetical protein
MEITKLVAHMMDNVRKSGQEPALICVSLDMYNLWQRQNGGTEPCTVGGVDIRIRDNYKPKTIRVLGDRDRDSPETEAPYVTGLKEITES